MKHGIVTNGKTTTLYGNSANHFIARMTATRCISQAEAESLILSAAEGPYRRALIDELARCNFKMTEDFMEKLRVKDEEDKKRYAEIYRKRVLSELASSSASHVKAKINQRKFCCICTSPILKDEWYRETWVDSPRNKKKAHTDCVKRALEENGQ